MTLAEWKRRLHPGMRLVCTYRWYWGVDKPAPESGREEITVHIVKATQLIYSTPDKPRVWMQFPKAAELKADEEGFELYFPSNPPAPRAGALMSRYRWLEAESEAKPRPETQPAP